MTDLPTVLPRRRAEVVTADFGTELVVLVPDRRRVHHLDEGLSLVLDACNGRTTTEQLVAEVADATATQAADVERWLASGLDQLREIGVLSERSRS